MEKPEGNKSLGRPSPKWENNIKMYLREVRWAHELDQSGSGQGQVAASCKCGNDPFGCTKDGQFLD
jgi:hypothetical protein